MRYKYLAYFNLYFALLGTIAGLMPPYTWLNPVNLVLAAANVWYAYYNWGQYHEQLNRK